jgi:hypothetical protein
MQRLRRDTGRLGGAGVRVGGARGGGSGGGGGGRSYRGFSHLVCGGRAGDTGGAFLVPEAICMYMCLYVYIYIYIYIYTHIYIYIYMYT